MAMILSCMYTSVVYIIFRKDLLKLVVYYVVITTSVRESVCAYQAMGIKLYFISEGWWMVRTLPLVYCKRRPSVVKWVLPFTLH